MANTIARHNRRGWRLDKPSLEQPYDSIIALCMALEAIDNQPAPVEVMALTRRYLGCGQRTRGSRCAACTRRREAPRKQASGRNTYQWQQLREQRKRIDRYRCIYCGDTNDLTVDVDPRLHGNHRVATLDDCRTACPSCNSKLASTGSIRHGKLVPSNASVFRSG